MSKPQGSIRHTPKIVHPTLLGFAIPYADDSGTKLGVELEAHPGKDIIVRIRHSGDTVYVDREDLPWLIGALQQIEQVIAEREQAGKGVGAKG